MHDDVVEEEDDWMWEKDGRRKEEVSKCRLAFCCSCSCFSGLRFPVQWWWTEVVLAVAGQRAAKRGCDVRSQQGPILATLAAARATTSILPPNSNSELHDTRY
jgi:hypothetical protein